MNIDHSYLKNRKGTKARKREKIKNKIERDEKKKKKAFHVQKIKELNSMPRNKLYKKNLFQDVWW